jgi:hypothetical protein
VKRLSVRWLAATVVALLVTPGLALGQSDEIQVYDGGLAPRGVFNLTWHNNFTPKGETTPGFPGAVVADKSFNGVTEWALGVTNWFEAGLYLPLYSWDKHSGWGVDGFKLRTLFAVPNADNRIFVYGANFELSYNARRWDTSRVTSEIRPIVGWHLKPVDIIFNPILDTAYDGLENLVFAPATRVAYNAAPSLALAVEEYADFGPLHDFHQTRDQSHQLYGIVDYSAGGWDIEAGAGFGLTKGSDAFTLKLILSRNLNKGRLGQ